MYSIILLCLLIVWVHCFADFFLQTDKMATSKSSSIKWLTIHVSVYIIPFLILFGPKYALVNFIAHWITDFFSSKATKALWGKNKVHWFFAVIGVDQALHMTALLLTIPLIGW